MPWKTVNGRRYFYRVIRDGDRTVTEYAGGGIVGQLAADMQAAERVQAATQRNQERLNRKQFQAADQLVRKLGQLSDCLMKAILLAHGYHQHDRGRWHRRRDRSASTPQR